MGLKIEGLECQASAPGVVQSRQNTLVFGQANHRQQVWKFKRD